MPRSRILIIDDEEVICEALVEALSAKHEARSVLSSRAALELLSVDSAFDLILCDCMMPGMTGIELYRKVCDSLPELAGRFVFITGGALTPETQDFVQNHPDRVLYKPFRLKTLQNALEKSL